MWFPNCCDVTDLDAHPTLPPNGYRIHLIVGLTHSIEVEGAATVDETGHVEICVPILTVELEFLAVDRVVRRVVDVAGHVLAALGRCGASVFKRANIKSAKETGTSDVLPIGK